MSAAPRDNARLWTGTATVVAGGGAVERRVEATDQWREPAREALYRLLLHDPQTRP